VASTTGPDLAVGRQAVENLMDDGCVITRPPPPSTASLDPDTGHVVPDDAITVYSAATEGEGGRSLAEQDGLGGMCMIRMQGSRQPSWRSEGGALILNDTRELKIPVDAPLVKKGDRVQMTTSRRDPQLVTMGFRVEAVVQKTFAISRTITVVPG